MSIPNKEKVQPILDGIRDKIVEAILGAWSDWLESGKNGTWHKRGRACYVWEQIIARIHKLFDSESGVKIFRGNETVKFMVNDVVLFRFKKANMHGISSNIETQLAMAFHDHEQDLFGLPEVQRVEIVYKLNALETNIHDICVVARENDRVVWEYSLHNTAESTVLLSISEPEESEGKPIVRLVETKANDVERKKRD